MHPLRLLASGLMSVLVFGLTMSLQPIPSIQADVSLAITTSDTTIRAGETTTFSATLNLDGTTKSVSALVTWNSSNRSVGTITRTGVFNGVAAGTTVVTATMGGTGTASPLKTSNGITVTVAAPPPPAPAARPPTPPTSSSNRDRPATPVTPAPSASTTATDTIPWQPPTVAPATTTTGSDQSAALRFSGDVDRDGLPDFMENLYFGNLNQGPNDDFDNDRLTNAHELQLGTDPTKVDSDNDGIDDYAETQLYKTNPLHWDSDGDGLSDDYERRLGTNPLNQDSDGDHVPDGVEIRAGSNPTDPQSTPRDNDSDGLPDQLVQTQLNYQPTADRTPGITDSDNDGVSDREELIRGTDPNKVDTDNDGLNDGEEIYLYGTDPSNSASNLRTAPKLAITNLKAGDKVVDDRVVVTGTANPQTRVSLLLVGDSGQRTSLADSIANEKGVFLLSPERPLVQKGDVNFSVVTVGKDNTVLNESKPVKVKLDLEALAKREVRENLLPQISDFADVTIPTLVREERSLEFELGSETPVLRGRAPKGALLIANWQSLLFTSSLIADNQTGEFQLKPPQPLPAGPHQVTFYLVKDNVRGPALLYKFLVSEKARQEGGSLKTGTTTATPGGLIPLTPPSLADTSWQIWLGGGVLVLLIIGLVVYLLRRRK